MKSKIDIDNTIEWFIEGGVGNSSVELHIQGFDNKGNTYFATSYIALEGESFKPMNIVKADNHSFDRAGNRFVNGKCINPKAQDVVKTYRKAPPFEEVFGAWNPPKED